jgi:hypothetical protein
MARETDTYTAILRPSQREETALTNTHDEENFSSRLNSFDVRLTAASAGWYSLFVGCVPVERILPPTRSVLLLVPIPALQYI